MPSSNSDDAQMVSVRLPRALIQRLDRYLDWWNLNRQAKFSRNAAIRQALDSWLDDQEQCAGFLEPQFQRQQFQNAYHSLSKRHEWVAIHHLRQLMPWSRERFDAMVETGVIALFPAFCCVRQWELTSPCEPDVWSA